MNPYTSSSTFQNIVTKIWWSSSWITHNLEVEWRFLVWSQDQIWEIQIKLAETVRPEIITLKWYNYTAADGTRFRIRQEWDRLILAQKIAHTPANEQFFMDHEFEYVVVGKTLQKVHDIIWLDGRNFDKNRTSYLLDMLWVEISIDSGTIAWGILPPYLEIENTRWWDGTSDIHKHIQDAQDRIQEVLEALGCKGEFTKKTMAELLQL